MIRAKETKVLNQTAEFLAESQKAASAIREEAQGAYERAKIAGFEEGKRAGAEEAAKVVMDASFKLQTELSAMEQVLGEIAMEAVQKVLGHFDNRDLMARALREAITERQHEWGLTIRVVPHRVEEMEATLRDLLGPQYDTAIRTVEGDAQLRSDSCVIVSQFGLVEIGLEQQLRALKEALGLN